MMLASSNLESVDAVVIGAGVVGLACGRALARAGYETMILERHEAFGTETSARNSEVIHAGLYYPTGSLKARLCVDGNRRLYDFCSSRGVDHRRCGKLIVANSTSQEEELDFLLRQGQANGVAGLTLLTAAQAKGLEPALECTAALHSETTGILDSHGFMVALAGEAQNLGAIIAPCSPVSGGRIGNGGIVLRIGGSESIDLHASIVINAAGLQAPQVASRLDGFPIHQVPSSYWAKGNYYAHAGRVPFSHLIYPVPEPGGLGVHLTLDLGGQARFGPDVEWVNQLEYSVDPGRADHFYAEVRRYWPALADFSLVPAFCGIRPKISGPRDPAADFCVQGPEEHGIPGLVNLFGIESPGLTSSLALADHVISLVI